MKIPKTNNAGGTRGKPSSVDVILKNDAFSFQAKYVRAVIEDYEAFVKAYCIKRKENIHLRYKPTAKDLKAFEEFSAGLITHIEFGKRLGLTTGSSINAKLGRIFTHVQYKKTKQSN